MAEKLPLGDIIDKLGVRLALDEGDMVTDVYCLVKVLEPDGDTRLAFAWSDGISWLERMGMVTVAQAVESPAPRGWRSSSDGT